ncbi:MAG: DUF1761 domain-containing protein [Bacteroidales bacterium]|jgi:hypothetical protein|nr:DUF1761 domain-containing protein [Bacteroidales bacterium]
MEFPEINYLAVLLSALAFFIIGSIWYSPLLFAKSWMKELGFTKNPQSTTTMFKIFGLAFLLMLIMAFNLAAFIGNEAGFQFGLTAGALTGIGWVALAIGILYLFERKSFRFWLINAGYMAVGFSVMGAIIGAMQ